MKKIKFLLVLLTLCTASLGSFANEADSAYLFSYVTGKGGYKNGLHYAWSVDKKNWHGIGPEFRFLFSDFGNWGTQKKLINPFVFKGNNDSWHCIWSLNDQVGQFAHAETKDLYTWGRQSYPEVMRTGNVKDLEVSFDESSSKYLITWLSEIDGEVGVFKTITKDFKSYTPTVEGSGKDRLNARITADINGAKYRGVVNKVPWSVIDGLIKWYEWSQFHEQERSERMTDDPERFESLEPVDAQITVNPTESKEISDMLIGVFFEDLNYAADGGLYAELIQNRGFEYNPHEKDGRDPSWNSKKAWTYTGEKDQFVIDSLHPVHINQKHYATIKVNEIGPVLQNEGFDGIPVKSGEKYLFSLFAKMHSKSKGELLVRLVDADGKTLGETAIKGIGKDWKKQEALIHAMGSYDHAHLEILPQATGNYALDMISLFPKNTFKGRKNGLRADLAKTIADINPRFVRFPGGCLAHGDGIDNIYRWKKTIGALETRKPQKNIWRYHQSVGLGYFEYFQFCEDIGAEPLPVLASGVPCQNSSDGGHGQQCGIPMNEMDEYVQDVLDLIEWSNGDKNTKWGKVRAEAGHPEPFNLKYVGIGNEDLITDVFEERFTMIYNAVKEKYPEITVIGTVGPTYTGTDYREGWELATKLGVPMVDEHYYQPPGWFINNQDFYDRYDRSKSKVYLGEYAAHIPGRKMNIETALCEALYLSAIERNGDVVSMTSFAPLLAKEGHTQWNPDLIYFNNTEVKPTVDYYVQKLYGQNSGDEYIPSSIDLSNGQEDVKKRVAISVVKDNKTGDYILKLINLLPVEVNSEINLTSLEVDLTDASLTVLTGKPTDGDARPLMGSIEVSERFDYQLPAYSFTVIRIIDQESLVSH